MAYLEKFKRPRSHPKQTIRGEREGMDFWRVVKVEGSKIGNRIARMRSHSLQIAPADYVARLRDKIDKAVGRS